MKIKEKQYSVKLRKQGMSLREIAAKLGVAKSSVSLWVRNINLTERQLDKIHGMLKSARLQGCKTLSDGYRNKRREYQKIGRNLAKTENKNFLIGCCLYWAEGIKSHNKNRVGFCNSDPNMIRVFIGFALRTLKIPKRKIAISIHHYSDNAKRSFEIERYWLKITKLNKSNLKKSQINSVSKCSKRLRGNTIPMGTCHIAINSVKAIQTIYGGIQEFFGIDVPEWLG